MPESMRDRLKGVAKQMDSLPDALERLRAERAFADETDAGRRPVVLDLLFGDLSDPLAGFFRLLSRLRRS